MIYLASCIIVFLFFAPMVYNILAAIFTVFGIVAAEIKQQEIKKDDSK